jgi:hypothetical protein
LTSVRACCRRYRSTLHHVWTHYSKSLASLSQHAREY